MKKVLFVIGTPWASGYYRMSQAANLLASHGFAIETVMFDTIEPLQLVACQRTLPGLARQDLRIVNLLDFDGIVFQLVWDTALLYVIDALNAQGKMTSMEIDDDYFSLPHDNPSFIGFHPKTKVRLRDGQRWGIKYNYKVNTKIDVLKQACRKVHMLQVSTPELAKVYRPLNSNIAILENCVENLLYDIVPKRVNKKPVIGWFGTSTHMSDLALVLGCFPPEEDYSLLLAGFPEAREQVFKNFSNIEVIPPYRVSEVPNIVAKCDIGIAPLRICRFNDGKSDLKGVEFGAGRVPVIASDVAPYRRWIRHGVNGYLVSKNKVKYWRKYLRELVQDRDLCLQMGEEAKRDALKRDASANIYKYIDTYFT